MTTDLSALGPFFAVALHEPATVPLPPWQPFGELLADLDSRVQPVRSALALSARRPEKHIELRVAASTAHLGVVARLVAPVVAADTLAAEAISLDVEELHWQNQLGGPFPLSVSITADPPGILNGCAVEAITHAFAKKYSLSLRVLWGNVASAANGAARLIATARPDLAARAYTSANAVLSDPRVEAGKLHSGADFRRNSCCLIYRLVGDRQAVCGDCVLQRPASGALAGRVYRSLGNR